MLEIERAARRLHYYFHNIGRDALPQLFFRKQLSAVLNEIERHDIANIARRLNHYNKLSGPHVTPETASAVGRIPMRKSRYYYDLKEHARYFPRHFKVMHIFGDVTVVPDVPAIVKSRPISGDNSNAVLMKLDKYRHFQILKDKTRFEDKIAKAGWRGGGHNPKRIALVAGFHSHPLCDVGRTSGANDDPGRKGFLTPVEQMGYRYLLSIEGVDVATNLKWVMASNSLCMMPKPTYETWFMEGLLEQGAHYVQLRDDFADLEDKIVYYERHQDEAREIIRNANAHVRQFADKRLERLLSLLVLYKYFALSGQLDADPRIASLWAAS